MNLHPDIAAVLEGRSQYAVITGDCLAVLPTLPEGCVDAVVTDPPYGIAFQSAWRIERERFDPIANDESPAVDWIPAAFAASRDGAPTLCFCEWRYAEDFRGALVEGGQIVRSQIIWNRVVHGMGDLDASFAPCHDIVWFATRGAYTFPGDRPKSVLTHQRVQAGALVHPNEKPVALLCDLITATTRLGDLVLDPFCGSGTTGVACIQTGRRFIGIELEEKYAAIARRRIADAAPLFVPPPAPAPAGLFAEGQ